MPVNKQQRQLDRTNYKQAIKERMGWIQIIELITIQKNRGTAAPSTDSGGLASL